MDNNKKRITGKSERKKFFPKCIDKNYVKCFLGCIAFPLGMFLGWVDKNFDLPFNFCPKCVKVDHQEKYGNRNGNNNLAEILITHGLFNKSRDTNEYSIECYQCSPKGIAQMDTVSATLKDFNVFIIHKLPIRRQMKNEQ